MTPIQIAPIPGDSVQYAARAIAHACADTHAKGSMVWLCGNGGSAEIANHAAVDLVHCSEPPIRAISLCANVGLITAIGNDLGFEQVFAAQLDALAHTGDVLAVMSVSGRSENIYRAIIRARKRGCFVIGLFGRMPLQHMADSCHLVCLIDSDDPFVVEPMFSLLWHEGIRMLRGWHIDG